MKEIFYSRYRSSKQVQVADNLQQMENHYARHLIRQHFPKQYDIRILDLGCGSGSFLFEANKAGYRNTWGVDISQELVDLARANQLTNIVCSDIIQWLADCTETFDLIILVDVLEHFTKPEIVEILQSVHRHLNLGGSVLLHVPNGEGLFMGSVLYGDFTHETAFTRNSMRQLSHIVGYSRHQVFEDKPIVHGFSSWLRFILWVFFAQFMRLCFMLETGNRNLILSRNITVVLYK